MASLKVVANTFLVTQLFLLLNTQIKAQNDFQSPCPELFVYEQRSNEPDKWYGVFTLLSEFDLSGISLRVILDKPALQLGNWFSDVESIDNKEYLFKNPNFTLKAVIPERIRFFVKYNTSEPPPKLILIRLNDKTVCPAKSLTDRGGEPNGGGSNTELNAICGTVVPQARPLITYGEETHEAEFPWHAALYQLRGVGLVYVCGASLISRYHLLTVVYCVTKGNAKTPLNPDNLVVYLGKYYLKQSSNLGIQERKVAEITPHPQYNSQTFSNNIALIKLTMPVNFTDYIRPVCLWQESPDLSSILDRQGTVIGWGLDETGKPTQQLTQAKMPVVSQETCVFSHPEFYSRFTSSKTYCAGYRNGTSVCSGDSGGGMVFPKSSSNPNNPVWQLRGLVSVSVPLQEQATCDTSHYIVFEDSAKHLDWIKNTIK